KKSLEEIINTINQDSRRLFTETFAAIRTHFQEPFRKLFGGGMADILLEDENDILESGIEVIARPPGKELRSISLMSGGEKTLTAVALLLAIFRSKPSPFCILDEVDAALDEANISRFTAVLRHSRHLLHHHGHHILLAVRMVTSRREPSIMVTNLLWVRARSPNRGRWVGPCPSSGRIMMPSFKLRR